MPIGQEPPGGDFVAYLKVLERESAARLNIAPVPIDTAKAAAEAKAAGHGAGHAPVLDRQQAEALLARLGERSGSDSSAAITLAIGIALLLWAVVRNGGIFPLAAGLGAIIWSVSRLRAARAQRMARRAPAQLAKVFGKRPDAS
jgi:hypothetical protein